LSIYTNYLIEGISTGGADQDKDGAVSVDELHDYAKRKVQDTVPKMNPEIYAIKEGYKIRLAKATPSDPKLKYHREVEQIAHNGDISLVGRTVLDQKRKQLKLSLEEADAIEEEVLRPQREYQQNLERYEQYFVAAITREHPLSEFTRNELKQLQQVCELTNEDVASIEARWTPLKKGTVLSIPSELTPVESPPTAVSVLPKPPANQKSPLLVGTSIVVFVAAITGFAVTIGVINRPIEQQEQGTQPSTPTPSESPQDCFVLAGSKYGEDANIRSRPAAHYDNVIDGVKYGDTRPVTGKKTPGDWIQVKLPDGRLGWMGPLVIRNQEEMLSCLRTKGILDESVPDEQRPSPSFLAQLIPVNKPPESIVPFTACPGNTTLYLLGETKKHHFAVCGENGEPRYYIGESKYDGERLEPPVPWSNDGFSRGNVLYDPPFYGVTHSSNNKIRVYTNKNSPEYNEFEVIRLYKDPNILITDSLSPLESPNIEVGNE
ncbi:MAG TPA: SH3 domain-containing protein, partial [Coleofasciculaceae cyanobacterium]